MDLVRFSNWAGSPSQPIWPAQARDQRPYSLWVDRAESIGPVPLNGPKRVSLVRLTGLTISTNIMLDEFMGYEF